ncbi:hypothetical protein AB0D22_35480, partial [Kitasatospora sp. NPDC048538]|uniref:hypothetical protein n=1 Tax=Kitasatospora sp. NPDC048538 TaxID=3155633 RepID=UPI0033C6445B
MDQHSTSGIALAADVPTQRADALTTRLSGAEDRMRVALTARSAVLAAQSVAAAEREAADQARANRWTAVQLAEQAQHAVAEATEQAGA